MTARLVYCGYVPLFRAAERNKNQDENGFRYAATPFGGDRPLSDPVCIRIAEQTKHSKQLQTAAEKRRIAHEKAVTKAMPSVRGMVFHCCSCAVPCPCMFNGKDVEGCNIVYIYHITDGGFEGKGLNGVTVICVPHPEELREKPGAVQVGKRSVANVLYVPAGLTPKQDQALVGLFSENVNSVGMHTLVRHNTPISFRKEADGYDVEIPQVFHAKIQSIAGADGKQIVADHLALSEGSRWFVGRSLIDEYQDSVEKEWHLSMPKGNGSWTFFAWRPHSEY